MVANNSPRFYKKPAAGWADLAASWQTWTWSIAQASIVDGVTAVVSWARRRYLEPAEESDQ